MSLTIHGKNRFLDAILGSGTPASVWVAVTTDTIGDLDDGTTLTEPTGGAYARAEVVNNVANWSDASDGLKANSTSIFLPTATDTWGTMRYFAILDDETAGEVIVWGGISSRLVLTGTTLRFEPDALVVTINQEE